MSRNGILLIRRQSILEREDHDRTLPVFCADRELVYSVLKDAMDRWVSEAKPGKWNEPGNFYQYANGLGKARTNSHLFIGPESIPYVTPEQAIRDAGYVFLIDYINGKIETVK